MNDSRVTVCLSSGANSFSLNLLEILLSKNCFVYVVSNDVNIWNAYTSHLLNRSRFRILDFKEMSVLPNFSYSIFCCGFEKKAKAYEEFYGATKNKNLIGDKTLVIFPFESFSHEGDARLNLNDSFSVLYIGDLIGPRLNLVSDLLAPQIVYEILMKRKMTVAVGELFYPIFVADAARTVVKWLFSFGPYGREMLLLGPGTSATTFWSANQRIVGNIKLNYENDLLPRIQPRNMETKTVPINLSFALEQMYSWFSHSFIGKAPKVDRLKKPKTKKVRKLPRYSLPIIVATLLVLLFPFLAILSSAGLYYFFYRDFVVGKVGSSNGKVLAAKTLLTIGKAESEVLSYVPLLGYIYKETGYVSFLGTELANLATSGEPLLNSSRQLFGNVLGGDIYDPAPLALDIKSGLANIYQEVAKIQAETLSARGKNVLAARIVAERIDFEKVKNLVTEGETLVDNLPDLLGKNGRKTYLILFKNNMELRPTGGFIGSFGLLTFDAGRMSDLVVSDVYSADGQLRGHVEPPTPIKKYLGEANWWLRDSNWDPDFPTSAKRAEWFLDKEMDQRVDGVFAVDLYPIRDALKTIGPIFLADYNLEITSSNLYEETQAEAEENFFPGSHQKASFLSALSRNLIISFQKLSEGQKISILRSIVKNFEQRHIQAFLHDDAAQTAISRLNWSGEVLTPSCGSGCYADLVGVVEANVGVNKANYFISRQISFDATLVNNQIVRRLNLSLKNSASPALGLSGKYGVYIRIFAAEDAVIGDVKSITGQTTEVLTAEVVDSHGRKEVGVFLEVLAGQTKQVEFNWGSERPAEANSYGLYIRKQAGVSDDPWSVFVSFAKDSLTKRSINTYNTVLTRDFFYRANF